MKTAVRTENAPQAIGPYSQGVSTNNFIFISGQLGLDKTGKFPDGGAVSQARQAMENIKAIIEASGSKMDDIVKTTILLSDINDFAAINDIYSSYFDSPYPARACYQVAGLPRGGKVEIEAIAVKPGSAVDPAEN